MGTRAVVTFYDHSSEGNNLPYQVNHRGHHVYRQHDGYPSNVLHVLQSVVDKKMCWDLPRFEADEFATGYVAHEKEGSGNIRLLKNADDIIGLSYRYYVTLVEEELHISVYAADFSNIDDDDLLFRGTLSAAIKWEQERE